MYMKEYQSINYLAKWLCRFNIKTTKLARFILYVKKGYRDVPYHSWLHAFNVGQWAYAAISNYKLISQGYFT